MKSTTETPMDATKARAIFDGIIATENDPETVARVELLREWVCNPTFRQALSDYVFEATYKPA